MKNAKALDNLRYLTRELKLAGEDDLAEKISCAISVVAGTEHPKTEYSYSYIMRNLRKGDDDRRIAFQRMFKETFDDARDDDLENPEQIALMAGIKAIEFDDA